MMTFFIGLLIVLKLVSLFFSIMFSISIIGKIRNGCEVPVSQIAIVAITITIFLILQFHLFLF